jgi:hypothetical protein
MNIDNFTIAIAAWGLGTAAAMIIVAACKGCCIKKLMGKPCQR